MNPPRCDELDYIQFLIAAQRNFTCTEAARCQPDPEHAPSHDAFTRLLTRQPPDTAALWQEVEGLVSKKDGVLVLDDTTLDKPYARRMELVTRHWSGKYQRVVMGINLITLLWTGGRPIIPTDFRVYDKPSGKTKNGHFRDMLKTAAERGFMPFYVLFDSWYSSLENLKTVRECGTSAGSADRWQWLTRLKGNRHVNPDGEQNVPLETVEVPPEGRVVHLKGYGLIKVFQTAARDGGVEYWATGDLEMTEKKRRRLQKQSCNIEAYHRGLKQCCGIERAQVRSARAQRSHFLLSIKAFVRLEVHRLRTGISWYEAKAQIIRDAIRLYLQQPLYQLSTA